MRLELITLLGVKVDRDVYEIIAPTAAGEIGVFPGHEPLVTIAVPGAITIRTNKGDSDDKLEYYAVTGGVIEISRDRVRILVDEADHGDDITEAESKQALERALKLREDAKNPVDLENAQRLIGQQRARLNVAGLRRRHRRS